MSTKLKKTLTVAAIILFGVFSVSNFETKSNDIVHVENYRVRQGDTFWTVTQYYRDLDSRDLYIFEYQDEIRELNPQLKDKNYQLQPNDFITIRYYQVSNVSKP